MLKQSKMVASTKSDDRTEDLSSQGWLPFMALYFFPILRACFSSHTIRLLKRHEKYLFGDSVSPWVFHE